MPAGVQSQGLMEYLEYHGINIAFFVDNDSAKQGVTVNGKEVFSFEQFISEKEDKVAIITSNPYAVNEISHQCHENNFYEYMTSTIGFHFYFPDEIDNSIALIEKNFNKYVEAYSLFNDDLSKKTFKNKLKYFVTHDSSYLTQVVRPKEYQYFEPDIYNVTENDCFIDCGAFTGDTLETCLALTNGKIAAYYAFEPDSANYAQLSLKADKSIQTFNAGVFSKNTTLRFANTSNAISKVSDSGASIIEVLSIDAVLKGEKATFLKMDIEGSEIDALIGAKKTIKMYKPILAISVYHKFDDMFEIPELIQNMNVDYKYFLRHYMEDYADTILYAVAK